MKIILFIGILTTLIVSCKKQDGDSSPPENILSDNAFIVDTASVLATYENSFEMKNDINFRQPKVGEIILVAPSSNCPYGMLRKVVAINSTPNNITYTTEQSNLNDAFKELHINYTYSDTYSGSQTFASGTSLTLNFQNNLSIGNGVKLNGTVTFDYPTLDIQYEKENGSELPKYILIKAELNSKSQGIELTNSNSSPFSVSEKIFKTFDNLPTVKIVIPIGGFPFPVLLKQTIDIACLPFELNGKFKFEVKSNFNAVLGCKYENGTWHNISSYSISTSSPTTFTYPDYLNFSNGSESPINASLTFLNPRYTITPMFVDIIKGTLEAPSKLTLELKNTQPNYSLKYKLDLKGGIKQTFWLGGLGSFSLSGTAIETTLLEGNWDTTSIIYGTWKVIKRVSSTGITTYPNCTPGADACYMKLEQNGVQSFSYDGINFGTQTTFTLSGNTVNFSSGNSATIVNLSSSELVWTDNTNNITVYFIRY